DRAHTGRQDVPRRPPLRLPARRDRSIRFAPIPPDREPAPPDGGSGACPRHSHRDPGSPGESAVPRCSRPWRGPLRRCPTTWLRAFARRRAVPDGPDGRKPAPPPTERTTLTASSTLPYPDHTSTHKVGRSTRLIFPKICPVRPRGSG